ncbi:molybdopterin-synthase adenylyltransferase MoeB [Pseudooceanicola sp. CBS1P-1]|uniref:Molybdopterin-synthase adenylyltransferase n=1 Tax=Pseudooceanicola albus TaxID=2692189 RepID=A0A6L7G3K9_9RHOB|nr:MULTISPECIES: molybdopterin-synthase adenylyltransferase MoeB [Pseudooceanicola]MBT9384907.1 molybdopterin-synthase adenylyltransferase MoeB [Pseudooceanicola endophyticus]MXN18098.1 molybdopterin-synthase adenylyltransferase MoeB [Pseudooceanicola albus]
MGWLLLALVLLWIAGGRFGVSVRARSVGLAAVWLLVLAALLPLASPLRAGFGGGPMPWALLGVAVAVVLAYRQGLAVLRARAVAPEPGPRPLFEEAELERYARHIILRELGGPGQQKLKQAKVLVIGAGGLGSPALLYLAGAGVGTIGVIDADVVDNSNLQRQVIHRDADIGTPKVASAARAMAALNPFITVHPHQERFEGARAADLVADYDIILDGTDNFETRYLANCLCVAAGKPLVSGALAQWEGQLSVFHPARGTPCYQCIFPEAPAPGLAPSCSVAGVLSPLPGVVGAMMAVETVKLIAGTGAPLAGEMLIYDALWGETRKIALKPRPDCPVCGTHAKVS